MDSHQILTSVDEIRDLANPDMLAKETEAELRERLAEIYEKATAVIAGTGFGG